MSFINDPLFQELPAAIRKTIEELHTKHPHITLPKTFGGVVGLHARCFDHLTAPRPGPKKGESFLLLILSSFAHLSQVSAAITAANNLRGKGSRKIVAGTDSSPSTVCRMHLSFVIVSLTHWPSLFSRPSVLVSIRMIRILTTILRFSSTITILQAFPRILPMENCLFQTILSRYVLVNYSFELL